MAMSGEGPGFFDLRENREKEEPRRFQRGDRVRLNNWYGRVNEHLQEDNRVGTVVWVDSDCLDYWLRMDKPVIAEAGLKGSRPPIIPEGYAYFAYDRELEPIESQKPFDIEAWRKNLKPGDKVRVMEDAQAGPGDGFVEGMYKWKGCVVTLKIGLDKGGWWEIEENDWGWDSGWFEPVGRKSELSELRKSKQSESRKTKKSKKQTLDPRLKSLIKVASELTQTIEETFRKTEEYPIFGFNLKQQEPVTRTQKPNLGESLYSLGVVLYHLYAGESEHNNPSYLLDNYPKPKDMPEEFWRVVDKLLKGEYRDLLEFKEDIKQNIGMKF